MDRSEPSNPPTAMRRSLAFAALVALNFTARPAAAQALTDTLFAWQGYGKTGRCQLALYPAPETTREGARTRTFVLRETSDNAGPSTLDDARYLVEEVGRTLGVDPADAYWVFHWGAFSFEDDARGRKELFLRATFNRNASGNLSAPSWRVVSREEVEELTDRRFH